MLLFTKGFSSPKRLGNGSLRRRGERRFLNTFNVMARRGLKCHRPSVPFPKVAHYPKG